MASLYELTGEYLKLLDMAESGEVDEEIVADTLEGVGGEIEDKAEACAKVIRSIEGDIGAVEAEIERLTTRKATLKNNASAIKSNLEKSMIATGKTKFKTSLFSFGIQKNPPSVVIDDTSAVPSEFWKTAEPTLDRAAVKRFLHDNEVAWAHLAQTEGLRIR